MLPWFLFYLDPVHQNKLTQGRRTCMGKWEQPPLLPSSDPTGVLEPRPLPPPFPLLV